jgi:HEXXH motif-containing protein
MIDVHQLSSSVFEQLSTGDGGPDAIDDLRQAQYSKHLLLIRFLLKRFPDGGTALADLLDRCRAANPDRFRAVIGAPLVGGWTAIACRAASQGVLADADRDHLAAIAVVAAAATGVDATVEVPVHDGMATLPGHGAYRTGAGGPVVVTAADGRLFADPGASVGDWLPVRSLIADAAGLPVRLALDDIHPYRHGYHVPPSNRLSATELAAWQSMFEHSWTLLATHLPPRAAELAAGLEALVPLAAPDTRSARSATLRHAFGVFGLTLPPSPHDFAVTLVHEFQHSKLSALLDLVALTDPGDRRRFFAPWRTDPRPLSGLLQGVYAFVGVADTWRALQPVTGVATARFAEARLQVDRGLSAIEGSGALTGDGDRFVAGLRRTADRLLAAPVPAAADRAAHAALDRTFSAWRDHNGM